MAVTAPISSGIHGNVHQHVAIFQSSAAADGVRFDLMRASPGDVILAVQMTINDPSNSGSQVDVGYDFDNTPDGATQHGYFMSNQAISSTGYQDSRALLHHRPLVFTDFGYVTMTIEGAEITAATRLVFNILHLRRVIA